MKSSNTLFVILLLTAFSNCLYGQKLEIKNTFNSTNEIYFNKSNRLTFTLKQASINTDTITKIKFINIPLINDTLNIKNQIHNIFKSVNVSIDASDYEASQNLTFRFTPTQYPSIFDLDLNPKLSKLNSITSTIEFDNNKNYKYSGTVLLINISVNIPINIFAAEHSFLKDANDNKLTIYGIANNSLNINGSKIDIKIPFYGSHDLYGNHDPSDITQINLPQLATLSNSNITCNEINFEIFSMQNGSINAPIDAARFPNYIHLIGTLHADITATNPLIINLNNLTVSGKEGVERIIVKIYDVPGGFADTEFDIPILKSNIAEKDRKVGIRTNTPQAELDVNGVTKTTTLNVINQSTLNGNVGVHTNTPQATLDVNGDTKTITLNVLNQTTLNGNVGINTNTPLTTLDVRGTTGTTSLYVSNQTTLNGNVGIGTTTPSEKLEVKGRIKDQTGYVMPVGGIIMWSGAIDQIPSGWKLCDGQNGTPDLRERFIVGAGKNKNTTVKNGSNYAVNDTGGENSHILTIAQMPSHSHTYLGFTQNDNSWAGGGELKGSYTGYYGGSYTSDPVGNDQPHENRPPYYALAFIMKQ